MDTSFISNLTVTTPSLTLSRVRASPTPNHPTRSPSLAGRLPPFPTQMKRSIAYLVLIVLGVAVAVPVLRRVMRHEFSGGAVLARVGDMAITRSAFEAELARRRRGTSLAERQAVLDDMVLTEALYAKAVQAGYERNEQLIQRFKRLVVEQYRQDHLGKADAVPAPQADAIGQYYQAHLSEFTQTPQVRPALIRVRVPAHATPEKRAEWQAKMAEIRRQATELPSSEVAFGDLARRHSEDQPTRYRGGDCGWVSRDRPVFRWPAKVLDAMFALQTRGALSPVIEAEDGYYLLKLIDVKPAQLAALGDVREVIEERLTQQAAEQRRAEFNRAALAGVRVEVHRDLLEKITPPPAVARNGAEPPTAMSAR